MAASNRERCSKCKKWKRFGDTVTLPEELYDLLEADNEFGICMDCFEKHTLEDWKEWIPQARKEGLSFKVWQGK